MVNPAHNRTVPRSGIWIVVLLFLSLAGGYIYATPYRQSGFLANQRTLEGLPAPAIDIGAPDERQHANYIAGLVEGQGFPVLKPGDPNLGETYQSHQPPLYYLLGAAVGKVFGLEPTSPSGIHLRWINALIGAITVIGLFRLGQKATGNDWVALLVASIGALIPMVLALHAAVSNDPLLFCLCTWTLVWLLDADASGWTMRRALLIGALAGLALNTKSTAVALLPLMAVAGYVAAKRDRTAWKWVSAAVVLAVVMALPWWMRNIGLYGDPLAMSAFREAFTGNPRTEDLVQALGPSRYWTELFGWWTLRSFFGVFGYMDIFWLPNLYRILAAITAIVAIGCLRKERVAEAASAKAGFLLSGTFFLLILILYVQFNLTYFQAQSRYLFPAIGPIALVLGTGLSVWLASRIRAGAVVAIALLVVANLINLARLPEEFKERAAQDAKLSSHPHEITRRILG
ncbi:MAG: hypothetical protein HONBIEJF_02403 [Fimbriimonadaceae bacterium]|nr:hypothetical protein [Fimbriimonadaceae bacterium]